MPGSQFACQIASIHTGSQRRRRSSAPSRWSGPGSGSRSTLSGSRSATCLWSVTAPTTQRNIVTCLTSGLWSDSPSLRFTSERGRTQVSVVNPAAVLGPATAALGWGTQCIVLERRRLCRRRVGTLQTLLRPATPLRRVPSVRTMSCEATNRGHAAKERAPWNSDYKASMRS